MADVVCLFGGTKHLRYMLPTSLEGVDSADSMFAIYSGRDDAPVVYDGNAPNLLSVQDS